MADEEQSRLEHQDRDLRGDTKALFTHEEVPVKKIDGLNMPYLQVNMSDGTLCDLNGKPRLTKVLYVCYSHGKHDIFSLKETSICEYEVVILSPLLCQHPKYK
jgi:endoplasmic reticulum lectin 1